MSEPPALEVLVRQVDADTDAMRTTIDSLAESVATNARVTLLVGEADRHDVASLVGGRLRIRVVTVADPTTTAALANAAEGSEATFLMPVDAGVGFFARGLCDLADLAATTDACVAYADHAVRDADGGLVAQYKPAWSPDRLRCDDYIGAPLLFRTATLRSAGGFDTTLSVPSSRLDALWRLAESGARIAHLPHLVLEGGGTVGPEELAEVSTRHFTRTHFPAHATPQTAAPVLRIEPALGEEPLVSVIVPTAGASAIIDGQRRVLVMHAVESLQRVTAYDNYEVVAVIDQDCPADVVSDLADLGVRCIDNPEPFNFSKACNLGASHAVGEVLVLLNDDTEIVDADWLARLVMHLDDADVGAVGPKLLYEDGTVQHCGLLGRHGTIRHRYPGVAADEDGYRNYLHCVVTVAAVTGACLAVRSADYLRVGGLSIEFPLNYNDVDLCMKLRGVGKRVVADNQVGLRHFESQTRESGMEPWEDLAAQARWEQWLRFDPYDSPSFELGGFDDDPVPASQHLEALAHAMQQPVRVLPSAPLVG